MQRPQLIPGALLVTLGVLFLLDALDVLDAWRTVGSWWPALIVGLGLARMLSRPPDVLGGGITAGIGLLLLAFTLDVVEASVLAVAWPLALIAVGAWLLLGRGRRAGATGEDTVSAVVVFGGRDVAPTSRRFAGGALVAVFGGIDVDLRGCLPAEGARLDVTVVFGGCDVKVPPGWRVRMHGPAIFGGTENGTAGHQLPEDAPTIDLRTLALFGGIDVKVAPATIAS